jgi:hypothetical protein
MINEYKSSFDTAIAIRRIDSPDLPDTTSFPVFPRIEVMGRGQRIRLPEEKI